MISSILAVAAFSLLFVAWGLMRPADRKPGGCHACPHGDEPGGCAESCAIFEDLESKPKAGAVP
jgi:hypothetical protein